MRHERPAPKGPAVVVSAPFASTHQEPRSYLSSQIRLKWIRILGCRYQR